MTQVSLPLEEITANSEFKRRMTEAARLNLQTGLETGFTVWYAPSFTAFRFKGGHDSTCEYGGRFHIGKIIEGEKDHIRLPGKLSFKQAHYRFGRELSLSGTEKMIPDYVSLATLCEIGATVHFHPRIALDKLIMALYGCVSTDQLKKVTDTGTRPSQGDLVALNLRRKKNHLINPYEIIAYAVAYPQSGRDEHHPTHSFAVWQERTKHPLEISKHLVWSHESLPPEFKASRFYNVKKHDS